MNAPYFSNNRSTEFLHVMFCLPSWSRFLDTVQSLSKEAGPGLARWDVCDNIDLETILQEFESYYFVKFKKAPKIVKKVTSSGRGKDSMRSI